MLMCGVGAKSVAHLMKCHLLQWEVVKVKFLMNSNMILTVLNLHQKTDPKVQQDFKGQGHYDKVKSRSHHDAVHLQPLTNTLPSINFLHLTVSEIKHGQDFQTQGHYGKVKRSNQGHIMMLHTCTP